MSDISIESFSCFLCDDPPELHTAQEAVDHLVEDHDADRDMAQAEIKMLTGEEP